MASILDLRVPAEQFALANTLGADPETEIRIERVTAHDHGSLVPFAWVTTTDFDRFERFLAGDPTTADFSVVGRFGSERLYRIDWVEDVDLVVHLLLEEGGSLLDVHTDEGEWQIRLLCAEREALSRTYEFCEDHGLSITVDSIHDLEGRTRERFGLTDPQRRTLLAALEEGYYDVPRTVTLTQLADILDVSHQALSERLRRGHANLVESVLASAGGGTDRLNRES